MKLSIANSIRANLTATLLEYVHDHIEEDVGMTTSNSFNFPIVHDGEEGWVEVTIKVPKDDGDEGYSKREEYSLKVADATRKAQERAEAKTKKLAKAQTKSK